jgi:hypothetical protein
MSDAEPHESGLSGLDREILEFERAHWGAIPNKESAVRERFGLSLARYYQRVYSICRLPGARVYDAVLVRNTEEAAVMRQASRRNKGEGTH